jgi:hypothetical protein
VSRHQARRRRTYGRRQHELQERRERGLGDAVQDARGSWSDDALAFEVLEPPAFGLFGARFGFAESRG